MIKISGNDIMRLPSGNGSGLSRVGFRGYGILPTRIIDREINPYVDEWERSGQFPARTVLKKLGQAGFLGVNKPKEYGGLGLDYSYSTAVNETLGRINCGGVAMGIVIQTDVATPALARFGSDKLKKDFLVPSISGDIVSCLGVSEVGAGSDVSANLAPKRAVPKFKVVCLNRDPEIHSPAIQTRAVEWGGDLIINGSKMWITNGAQADWMALLANTSEGKAHKNKSLIVVPMNTPGVHVIKKIEKLGMHSSDTGQIFFEDVRVPQTHIIGEKGKGFFYQMLQFQEERLCGAALIIYPLQRAINDTTEYCLRRRTFGKPILHNQYVYFRLAELATELEAFRTLFYKTVELYVDGNDVTKWASMCKLKAGRLAREITDSCLQFWGGMGYTNEVLISRMFRDSRLLSIGGGADEIMLTIISKYMNMLPAA